NFGRVKINGNGAVAVSLDVSGFGGPDAFSFTAASPQTGVANLSSGGTTNSYILDGVSDLKLAEVGSATASLNVTNANAVITPSITPGTGTITTTDVNNTTALLPVSYTNIATVIAGGTSAVIDAPDDGDKVTISAA